MSTRFLWGPFLACISKKKVFFLFFCSFCFFLAGTFGLLNSSVGTGVIFKNSFSNSRLNRPSPRCRAPRERLVSPQTKIMLNLNHDLKGARLHAIAAAKKGVRNNSTIVGLPLLIADKNIIKQFKIILLANFFENGTFQEICRMFHKFLSPEFKYTLIVFDGDGKKIFSHPIPKYVNLLEFTSDIYNGLYNCGSSDFSDGDTGATFYLIQEDICEKNDRGVNSVFLQKLKTSIIKKGTKTTHFSPEQLQDFDSFKEEVLHTVEKGETYTVFIKIRYSGESYFMAGHQFGFTYTNENNISVLRDTIKGRVYEYLQEYGIENNDVVHISIGFTKLDKNLISEFLLDNKIKSNLGRISKPITGIPLSIQSKSLGAPLSVNVTDGFITRIHLKSLRNFLDLIEEKSELLPLNHKDKIGKFPDSWQFYETIINHIPCIVAINIISSTEIDKIRFTVEGAVYSRVIDSIEGKLITRKYNNKIIYFNQKGAQQTKALC